MALEMITIRELLRDPQYREYFTKVPQLPSHYKPENLPWRLLVQKKGETKWRGKRYGTYQDAFKGFKKMLPVIDNAAINCPSLSFIPPIRNVRLKGKYKIVQGGHKKQIIKTLVWKPQITADMEHHDWCPHCRRPSIFRYASNKAKMYNGFVVPPDEPALRCMICGASERIIDLRNPLSHQKWDSNRPKIYEVHNA